VDLFCYNAGCIMDTSWKNLDETKRFQVIRKAVLMEDEGHEHLITSFDTRKEAEEWRLAQNEYFTADDFYINDSAL